MTSETVRETLNHVWNVLESLGYVRALMGGVALATWNHPRATRDIDLLIAVERTDVAHLASGLASAGCRPKTDPPLCVVGTLAFAPFLYTPAEEFYDVQFDLMLAESDLQKSALERRVSRNVPGMSGTGTLELLTCEDLLLFKLVAGRLIDRADAVMLLRENRETLGMSYLVSWSSRLNLTADLRDVWREAFPHEACPV